MFFVIDNRDNLHRRHNMKFVLGLRVDCQFKRPANRGRHEISRYIETPQFMQIEKLTA